MEGQPAKIESDAHNTYQQRERPAQHAEHGKLPLNPSSFGRIVPKKGGWFKSSFAPSSVKTAYFLRFFFGSAQNSWLLVPGEIAIMQGYGPAGASFCAASSVRKK
jgi:hypothetical protein